MMMKNIVKACFTYSKNIPRPAQVYYKEDQFRSVHLTLQNKIDG